MDGKVNYKKASLYYLVGNLFNKGFAFLTVPIFSRILSTADYGLVTTYNAWVSILSLILSCAIHMGIRMSFVDFKGKEHDFLSVCITFNIVITMVTSIIIFAFVHIIDIHVDIKLIMLCIVHSFATGIILNYTQYQMMKYWYKTRTLLLVAPSLISIVVSIVIIIFFVDDKLYLGRIIPTAIIHVMFAIGIITVIYKRSNVYFNRAYLSYALKISLPLVVHGIGLNILSQSDRVMITSLVGSDQTGIYSLVYNFSMLAQVVTTTFEGIWVPWFIDKMKVSEREKINHMSILYIKFMTLIMIGIVMVGPEVIKFLSPMEYWKGIDIIPPIVLANYMVFMYSMYVNIEHYYKNTVYITINTLIAATINLILNFIFIPMFGYVAAAFTTLFAYFSSFILHAIYAKRLEPELFPVKFFVMPLCQIVFMIFMFYVFKENMLVRVIVVLVYFACIIYLNKNSIFEVFPNIRRKIKD